LESLQKSINALECENDKLRSSIREYLPNEADELLFVHSPPAIIASNPRDATNILDDPDYSLVKALQTAKQNFVITDPSKPDNPIVYASQGFETLTGYDLAYTLGRNCRFLQGPGTDPKAIDRIRSSIKKGEDTTVCMLNYRKDGSPFWNQFFLAALRDGGGNIVNYLGAQCEVSEDYAIAFLQHQEFEDKKR
jgi:PAS domain S-box-containing protein